MTTPVKNQSIRDVSESNFGNSGTWTRVTISDSQYGEVSVMVRKVDLTIGELVDELLCPAVSAKGYGHKALDSYYGCEDDL